MKRAELKLAQEDMIQACINAMTSASDRGDTERAEEIRRETARLAKRLTPETYWYGLGEPKPEGVE